MLVRVRFYGAVRTLLRQGQAQFELAEDATFVDLVERWAADYGPDLNQMLFAPDGKLHDFAKVYLNGQELEGNVWETPLPKSDASAQVDVFVLSPLVGGDLCC